MKKLLGLALTLTFLFTSSSLVHASTMGIFAMSHTTQSVSHCHGDTSSTSTKQAKQNMSCCELFTSNQYSEAKLEFKTSIKSFINNNYGPITTNYIQVTLKPFLKHNIAFSPGGQTSLGKYNKFSDLSAGIIVSLS